MPFDAKNTELAELLSRLCDGEIAQADWQRLETLLLNDPTAQDLYRRFVALDVELAWRGAGRPVPSQFDPPASALFLPSSSRFLPLFRPRPPHSTHSAILCSRTRQPW